MDGLFSAIIPYVRAEQGGLTYGLVRYAGRKDMSSDAGRNFQVSQMRWADSRKPCLAQIVRKLQLGETNVRPPM